MVTTIVVLIHALIGIAFISGLIGRWIVLGLAETRATEMPTMKTLAAAAGPFERIVIVAPMLVFVFGVAAAYLAGALDARSAGRRNRGLAVRLAVVVPLDPPVGPVGVPPKWQDVRGGVAERRPGRG